MLLDACLFRFVLCFPPCMVLWLSFHPKLWNYMYRPSVPSCRVCPVVTVVVVCPSVRPVVRPVVVRSMSLRPRPYRRRRPSSGPSPRRLSRYYLHMSRYL
jgi:hypothetical protein